MSRSLLRLIISIVKEMDNIFTTFQFLVPLNITQTSMSFRRASFTSHVNAMLKSFALWYKMKIIELYRCIQILVVFFTKINSVYDMWLMSVKTAKCNGPCHLMHIYENMAIRLTPRPKNWSFFLYPHLPYTLWEWNLKASLYQTTKYTWPF